MLLKISDNVIKFSILGIAFFLILSSGITNSLIGIGIAVWLLHMISKKDFRLKSTKLNVWLLLFFAISCISILNSIEPQTSVTGVIKLLKYLGIYFLIVENVNDIQFHKKVIIALAAGALVSCLDGIVQYAIGRDVLHAYPLIINVGLKRMTGPLRHCNDFGVYLVTVVGVIWSLALYEFKKREKVLWVLAGLLVTLCIGLTFSRGAALGFCGGMLVMGIIKKDKLILAILVLSILAMPFLIPSGVKEWSKATSSWLESFCNADRIAFYRSSIRMIKDHPIIGVGLNTFMKAYPKYKVRDVDVITADACYAHNNYLQMAGETGLVGLAVFLLAIAMFFMEARGVYRQGASYARHAALGLVCGIVAFLLNGLTESSFYFSKIVVVFWVIMGMAVSLKFIKNDYTD